MTFALNAKETIYMTDSKSIKRWIRAAGEMGPPEPLRISVTDLLREADEIHKFIVSNWEEDEDRPGLKSAGLEMTGETAGDVLSLRDAVEEAQKKYISILEHDLNPNEQWERGVHIMKELSIVLEWHAGCCGDDEEIKRFQDLSEKHADAYESYTSLSAALQDYGLLAKNLAADIEGLGGFSMKTIDEAMDVSYRLLDVQNYPVYATEKARKALRLRDQLAQLLMERMDIVRAAARLVYRNNPDIYRRIAPVRESRKRTAEYRTGVVNKKLDRKIRSQGWKGYRTS